MVFSRRETLILLGGDFLIGVMSLWVALMIRNLAIPSWGYFLDNAVPFVPFFVFSLAVFYIAGMYEKQTRPIRRVMQVRIVGAQVATVAVAAILFFIFPFSIAPKTILALYLVVSVVAETAWRFSRIRRQLHTEARTRALLVGASDAARDLFDEVTHNDNVLIRFEHHLDSPRESRELFSEVKHAVQDGVTLLVVDLSDPHLTPLLPELYSLVEGTIRVVSVAELYEELFDRVALDHLNVPAILGSFSTRHTMYDSAKRAFDILLVLACVPIALPLVTVAWALLKAGGGNAFFTTARVGKGGKMMGLYKMRTMLFNDRGDPELQKKNRVTTLGAFLRKSRIDELPQLWNVFVGELSFIGPRPELPTLVEVYEREIPGYALRHLITPGLSGWAQIHDYDAPRGGADVERTRRKLSFDLYYLRHRSFGLDLTIALKTLRALITFTGT